jgi:hypothetical protein
LSANKISLCVLLYGDYPDLAHRCLSSIWGALSPDYLVDVRLGLNEISESTRKIVDWFISGTVTYFNTRVITYDCPDNAYKYPLMLRMIHDTDNPIAEWVMWFDDDSYLTSPNSQWWDGIMERAKSADMLGKIYWQIMLPNQREWITKQEWYNAEAGDPPKSPIRQFKLKHTFRFCTGGWWLARSKIFLLNSWPSIELKLIGGDSMFGELCRHKGYRLLNFEDGVRINANDAGKHSSAPGRGGSPHPRDRGKVMLGNVQPEEGLHDFYCIKEVRDPVCRPQLLLS